MFGMVTKKASDARIYFWIQKYNSLLTEHNFLVRRINKLGGEEFLRRARIHPTTPARSDLSLAEIKSMIMLCHPDKHDGKESAKQITQILLKLRSELEK